MGEKKCFIPPHPRLFCLFVFTSFLLLFSIGDICGENSIVLKYQGMLQSEKKKKSSLHFPWNTGTLTGCSNWWDFEFPFLVESENIF